MKIKEKVISLIPRRKQKDEIIDETALMVEKIEVPDLKHYIVKGYEEIHQVKQEKEELENKLEEQEKYKQLYEATLVTLSEYNDKDNENKNRIQKLNNTINNKNNEIDELNEKINTYTIKMREVNEKEKNLNKKLDLRYDEGKIDMKNTIMAFIAEQKGHIGKDVLIRKIEKTN